MRHALPFLLFGLTFTAHAQHCINGRYAQTALFDSAQVTMVANVHYATSVRWPGNEVDSLRLDIYMPAPGTDPLDRRPLILLSHGGAFLTGNRADMAYYCMEMARRGFVTATLTYRMGWDCPATDLAGICAQCQGVAHKFRTAMYRGTQDMRAALRHLTHHADELGIDTSAVFLMGESAGSLNALHTAFVTQAMADIWCPSCVDDVGELDTAGNSFTVLPGIKGVVNHCGALGIADTIIDQTDMPVISFHDNQDIVVPYGYGTFVNCLTGAFGSSRIHSRLTQNGYCSQLNTVVNGFLQAPHCSYPPNAIIPKAACFLKGVLCGECPSGTTTSIWNAPDCTEGEFSVGTDADASMHGGLSIADGLLHMNGMQGQRHIHITDMLGRTVWQTRTDDASVPLPQLGQGVHLITVHDAQGRRAVVKWGM